jgi:Rps23 Pro-64 3,4-dihydroxylase Tpa1-like proline 4-hydroxylase
MAMAAISLAYDTVQVFDDAVPADLYADLAQIAPNLRWTFGWRAAIAEARYWHHEVAGGGKHNTQDMTDNVRRYPIPVFARYVDWLRAEMAPAETSLLRLYLNAHTFGTDGSPHTDTDREREITLVLFLNRGWKPEFGGETVVFDAAGEIEKSVMPKENRLLAFPSDRLHAPRPLSKIFGGLRMVLVAKLGIAEGERASLSGGSEAADGDSPAPPAFLPAEG